MADHQRFAVFAEFLRQRFPAAPRIFDVAGGQGRLNLELTRLGCEVTTFDRRRKHLDVRFAEREFTLAEPCHCDLVVGMHPDGATRRIIEYAAAHCVPFAVVPCCSDNGMPYRPWVRHLRAVAEGLGFNIEEHDLAISGRRRVVLGRPEAKIGEPAAG